MSKQNSPFQSYGEIVASALKRQFQVTKSADSYEYSVDPTARVLTMTGIHGNRIISIQVGLTNGPSNNIGRFTPVAGEGLSYRTSGTYRIDLQPELHAAFTGEQPTKQAPVNEQSGRVSKKEQKKSLFRKAATTQEEPVAQTEEPVAQTEEPIVEVVPTVEQEEVAG